MKSQNLLIKDKQFYKTLLALAIPVVLQNMITIGVNIMDTVMLGSYGEIQLSGSSLANNYIEIFHILNLGIGGGAAVMISQYWGAKDLKGVKTVITIVLRISLLASVGFTVLSAVIPKGILAFYTDNVDVIEKGAIYLVWSTPTFVLQGLVLSMTLTLRAMGKVKVPFITSIVSFFVNIFFNWVFIFGNLGAPEMQIAGAAMGTVIARVSEVLIIGFYYFRCEKDIKYRVKDILLPCKSEMPRFWKFGVPVIVSDALLTVGNNAIAAIMGHIGASFVAAFAIIAPVMRLCNVFTAGLGQAAATVTGNTVGSGDLEKSQTCGVTCFLLSIVTGLISGLFLLLLGPFIINFYNITPETKVVAHELLNAVILMVIFQSAQMVLTKGVLRGGGDTKFMMVADALFLWVLSVPLGYLCGIVWGFGPFIVYFALKSDIVVKTFWCMNRLFSRKWIKRIKID